jgi:hypothetical protein
MTATVGLLPLVNTDPAPRKVAAVASPSNSFFMITTGGNQRPQASPACGADDSSHGAKLQTIVATGDLAPLDSIRKPVVNRPGNVL